MTRAICVKLAQTKEEYEEAFRLMHESRQEFGLATPEELHEGIWITKQHSLPSSNTIVAWEGGEIVGAVSLFGESAFQLPLEEKAELGRFRSSLEGRIAEISLPGLKANSPHERDLVLALYHFALCFGTTYCQYDAFVTYAPLEWGARFAGDLQYEPILLHNDLPEGHGAYFRSAREGADFRADLSTGLVAEFRFPEKKFFLVAHQTLEPAVLDYFFNQRTAVFKKLNDRELRVLKNVYDFGEFARCLPERKLAMPSKAYPKHRRFPMNCEGYLQDAQGHRVHLQVLDVSREGLKVRMHDRLKAGTAYALTVSIGVRKQTEVIASAVWIDEEAQIAGLALQSGDRNWDGLIQYLEGDFLRVAA